jgi:prepilin-type N-terminal cleavage/methylation domain-containing protein
MRPRAGYTLFEVILVSAILCSLAMLAVPVFDTMSSSMRLTEAADQIRAAWADARAHAISEGRPYRFSYLPNRGNYRVAPDANDFWSSAGTQSTTASGNTPVNQQHAYIGENRLPRGVRLASTDPSAPGAGGGGATGNDSFLPVGSISPGSWEKGAVFQPDGSADDLEISFNSRGNRPLILRLRGLTGAVTVRKTQHHYK